MGRQERDGYIVESCVKGTYRTLSTGLTVVQRVEPQPATPVPVPAAPRPIQPPADALRKAAEDGPSTWASAAPVGDPDEVPGSWLQPGPALGK